MDQVIGLVLLGGFGYFYYTHLIFWKTFKAEAPEIYRENSEYSLIKYVAGFQWIDFALQKKYRDLGNTKLTIAGDRLCQVYMGATGISGFMLFVFCLAVFAGALYAFFANAF